MKKITKKINYKSFKRKEFVDYYTNICTYHDNDYFYGDGWKVHIGKERHESFFKMTMPCVSVTLIIDEDKADDFVYKMRLQFSRGGG